MRSQGSGRQAAFFRPGDPLDVIGMGGLVPPAVVWLLFNKDFFARQSDRALFLEMCPLVRDWLLDQSSGGFMHNMTLKRNRKGESWRLCANETCRYKEEIADGQHEEADV